jgi:hypothetical protein
MGCIVSVSPRSSTNLVGEEHEITVVIDGDPPNQIPASWFVSFEVISGPNRGLESTTDCDPSCTGNGDAQVSWSYVSTRQGTDRIRVCVLPFDGDIDDIPPGEEEFILDIIEEAAGMTFESLAEVIDATCETVTKTWLDPTATSTTTPTPLVTPTVTPTVDASRPNVGGAIVGVITSRSVEERQASRPGAVPTTAAGAGAAGGTVAVRPPSTGDGGLR